MNKEEIRKLIWDWETFSCEKEHISINEEVLSEWIDEFLKPKEDEDVSVRKIVRCEDPMVCLRGCSVHEQTCRHPIYENQTKTKRR